MKTATYLIALIIGLFLTAPVHAQTIPVSIDSDPQGAKFNLQVPNRSFNITGITPARINDVPTGKVIVHFENQNDCIAPKPQNRSMDSNKPMHFFGRYNCGSPMGAPVVEPTITVLPPIVPASQVSIRLSPHQLEFMPGNNVQFTVAVHNDAAAFTEPITVSTYFNEDDFALHGAIAKGGRYVGDGKVDWIVPAMNHNETWSVSLPLHVRESVHAHSLQVNARVQGANVATKSASAVIGTPRLPETGFGYDSVFLLLSALASAGFVWKRRLV